MGTEKIDNHKKNKILKFNMQLKDISKMQSNCNANVIQKKYTIS